MAAKKKTKKKAKASQPLEVEISMLGLDDDHALYVNFAEVTHSAHEFMLSFGRVPTKPSNSQMLEAKRTKILPIVSDVQVLLPPTVIKALVSALETQIEKYEAGHGKIEK